MVLLERNCPSAACRAFQSVLFCQMFWVLHGKEPTTTLQAFSESANIRVVSHIQNRT